MTFTGLLAVFYTILLVIDILAFVKKRKAFGIMITAVMALSIAALGYLWITSPM